MALMDQRELVELVIDGNQHIIPKDVLRRILSAADYHLTLLQGKEPTTFPKIDKAALRYIHAIRYDHVEMR